MAGGVTDREPHRHITQEGWLGQCGAPAGEIIADMEDKLVPAGLHLCPRQQRMVGAAIRVAHPLRQRRARAIGVEAEKLDTDAGSGAAMAGVEDMGGEAGHSVLTSSGWS